MLKGHCLCGVTRAFSLNSEVSKNSENEQQMLWLDHTDAQADLGIPSFSEYLNVMRHCSTAWFITLRKDAYSNILKISPSKTLKVFR